MPEQVPLIPFILLAVATLGGALGVVLARNVMHAVFWVLEVMVAVAGLFFLLSAEFLALVQVLVYAGAVAVLIVFTVMLTLRRREDAMRPLDASLIAFLIAAVFGGAAAWVVGTMQFTPAAMPARTPGVLEFGQLLFTKYSLPFEAASIVLLIALVGAVWWAGGDEGR